MLLSNINVVKRGKNNRDFDVGVKNHTEHFLIQINIDHLLPFVHLQSCRCIYIYIQINVSLNQIFYRLYYLVGLKIDLKLRPNDVHSITLILCLFFVSALVTSCYLCYCFYQSDDGDDLQCPITHHKGDRFDIQVHFHSI